MALADEDPVVFGIYRRSYASRAGKHSWFWLEAILLAVFGPHEQLLVDPDDLRRAEDVQRHMQATVPQITGYEIGLVSEGCSGVSGDIVDLGHLADGRHLFIVGDARAWAFRLRLLLPARLKRSASCSASMMTSRALWSMCTVQ